MGSELLEFGKRFLLVLLLLLPSVAKANLSPETMIDTDISGSFIYNVANHPQKLYLSNTLVQGLYPWPLTFTGGLNRVIFGAPSIVANGVASDDAALASAIATCAASGGTLTLPAGQITLTGATTITLQNCAIVGAQVPGGLSGQSSSYGTTILLTSTSVQPFRAASNWSIQGVNFYWPNQTTGSTSYPPLIVPVANSMFDWFMDHVNIINAYDGLQVTGGRFSLTNSNVYAMHDAIQSQSIGDQYKISNVHFTSGPWTKITNGANATALAVAQQNNHIFHLTGPTNNLLVSNTGAFGWRTAFLLDATATIGVSEIDMSLNFVGTFIDATSGGQWSLTVPSSFSGDCNVVGMSPQNATCFDLGTTPLWLSNSNISSPGTFIKSTGGAITLDNNYITNVGQANDGSEYYAINVSSTAGGQNVIVRNTVFSGTASNVHSHGIGLTPAISRLQVTGSEFLNLNESLSGAWAAGTNILNGNWSVSTTGSSDISMSGTTAVSYGTNNWAKPPAATLGTCGGTGAAISGALSGRVTVGTTNPTTSCAFTLPFASVGIGSGACIFFDNSGVALSASPSGTPATWTVTSGVTDIHSHLISYQCLGAQ